jgi:hypothetical protein
MLDARFQVERARQRNRRGEFELEGLREQKGDLDQRNGSEGHVSGRMEGYGDNKSDRVWRERRDAVVEWWSVEMQRQTCSHAPGIIKPAAVPGRGRPGHFGGVNGQSANPKPCTAPNATRKIQSIFVCGLQSTTV